MNYAKLTPESFLEKLNSGHYESIAGARRGIGKAKWSDKEKEEANLKANKHFGEAAGATKAAKKTATKKAPAVKTPAVKAAKAGAKVGRKPAAEQSDVKAPPIADSHYVEILRRAKNVTMAEVRKNPHAIIQLAEHGVQSGTNVLNSITALKIQNPNLEISDTINAAKDSVKASLHLMSLVLQDLSNGLEGMKITGAKPESPEFANGMNGAVPGTATYEAPTPSE